MGRNKTLPLSVSQNTSAINRSKPIIGNDGPYDHCVEWKTAGFSWCVCVCDVVVAVLSFLPLSVAGHCGYFKKKRNQENALSSLHCFRTVNNSQKWQRIRFRSHVLCVNINIIGSVVDRGKVLLVEKEQWNQQPQKKIVPFMAHQQTPHTHTRRVARIRSHMHAHGIIKINVALHIRHPDWSVYSGCCFFSYSFFQFTDISKAGDGQRNIFSVFSSFFPHQFWTDPTDEHKKQCFGIRLKQRKKLAFRENKAFERKSKQFHSVTRN